MERNKIVARIEDVISVNEDDNGNGYISEELSYLNDELKCVPEGIIVNPSDVRRITSFLSTVAEIPGAIQTIYSDMVKRLSAWDSTDTTDAYVIR